MSMFRFGGQRQRARLELQGQLSSISDRLDTLETAPAPTITVQEVQAVLVPSLVAFDGRFDALDGRIDGLEAHRTELLQRVKDLTFAVEEGIQRVSRTEQRIHGTIKRARKELAKLGYEDPGLEAEGQELRSVDGGGSKDDGVQPLPEGVAEDYDAPSSIKGVPASVLRRVRGFK